RVRCRPGDPVLDRGLAAHEGGGESEVRLPVGHRLRRRRHAGRDDSARGHAGVRGRAARHQGPVANPGERQVKIHEYQGKAVLAQYGVPVPKGKVAYTVDEAVEAAKGLGLPVVVKAQIHAGGRGKGGGVKLAKSVEECEAIAKAMLGMTLRTHQTGPEGRVVKRLLLEQGVALTGSKEMYLAILVDRASGRPVFMASTQGGMDIEEVAAKDPKAILKEVIDPAVGFQAFQARKLAFALGLPQEKINASVAFLQALYNPFEGIDAALLEINPFLILKD